MQNCKHCYAPVNENFCGKCGNPAELKRIDAHYIVHEIEHVLHFERGILFTIRELLLRPGKNVRSYLTEGRARLVKPIIFIIVTSLLYTLAIHFFNIEDGYVKYQGDTTSYTDVIMKWVTDHYGYSNILMGIVIAFWIRLFFRKSGYNLFEILILLCFVMGMLMLIMAVFVVIKGVTHMELITYGSIVAVFYTAWAIGNFFDGKILTNSLKAFTAYLLGMICFFAIAYLLGITIDKLFLK